MIVTGGLLDGVCCQPHVGIAEYLLVPDPERLDPALLAAGQRDEEPEFDEFGFCEVGVEVGPQGLVGDGRVPDDCARVAQRGLLPLCVSIRRLELEEVVVVGFGEPLPSSLDGPLDASVVAGDRLRDVDPTELLDLMVEHPVDEGVSPRVGERMEYCGNVRSDRLALGTRGGVDPPVLDDLPVAGSEVIEVRVADVGQAGLLGVPRRP